MNPIEKWGFSYCKKLVETRGLSFCFWLLVVGLDLFQVGEPSCGRTSLNPQLRAAGGPATLPWWHGARDARFGSGLASVPPKGGGRHVFKGGISWCKHVMYIYIYTHAFVFIPHIYIYIHMLHTYIYICYRLIIEIYIVFTCYILYFVYPTLYILWIYQKFHI